MDVDSRVELVSRNTREIITIQELRTLLETNTSPKAYLGFEPSGLFHIGWLIWANKVRDMISAGIDFTLLAATWHAWINDKLGGDLQLIHKAAKYVLKVLEAWGIPIDKLRVVYADEIAGNKDYWALVIRVAKANTLARVKRALTIMGRKESEAELDFSKLIYPAMQVADIFYLDVDIALGGTDQRKAHMLARDTAEKLGYKKVIAIHTPLLTGLLGVKKMGSSEISEEMHAIEFKMSKSKPETAIFVHDEPDEIRRKIRKAYCPPREVKYNAILEINKYILFAKPGFKLVVERPEKYGGTIVYEDYKELEEHYAKGELHPLDLKNATANALIEVLKPIRLFFEENKEARTLLEELKKATVTR